MPEGGRPLPGTRETLEVEGTVREALPNALFRVDLAAGASRACCGCVPGTRWWLRSPPTTRDAAAS
jgi:hypothetical protein